MNKYVLDKRKSIIKLNTDTLDLKSIDVVTVLAMKKKEI